jgi:hypothetical protein
MRAEGWNPDPRTGSRELAYGIVYFFCVRSAAVYSTTLPGP